MEGEDEREDEVDDDGVVVVVVCGEDVKGIDIWISLG